MSQRRRGTDQPEQLSLPTPSASNSRQRIKPAPEQAAKAYIARRAKPSVVPGHVKLTFTLDMPRELAEHHLPPAEHGQLTDSRTKKGSAPWLTP